MFFVCVSAYVSQVMCFKNVELSLVTTWLEVHMQCEKLISSSTFSPYISSRGSTISCCIYGKIVYNIC